MPHPPPSWLAQIAAVDRGARDRAWEAFLGENSALILHVIRRTTADHDIVMDRYAFILDALGRDDCRRLRHFAAEGGGKFSTWLVAVVRRLCVDEHRTRYGRPQSARESSWEADRRSLVDLIGDEIAVERLQAAGDPPDAMIEAKESHQALADALMELDAAQRLVLRLRFEDDVSVPEIARLLGYESAFKLYREIDRLLLELRRALTADVRGGKR